MIRFGAWSITLLIGSLHGLAMALLLWNTRANRLANRWLAALLAIVVLMVTPYTIGYAGFYDRWPWLTFAPFFWQLGIGPLVYLYVRQLGEPTRPRRWGWHFAPLALQVGYYTVLFTLPTADKWRWNDSVHVPWVLPLENLLTVASIGVYLGVAWTRYRLYQDWLANHSAAREEYRATWLLGFLATTGLATAVATGFGLAHLVVHPLSYFDEFPLYVAFTILVYYLGLEGWRNAGARYPQLDATASGRAVHRAGAATVSASAPDVVGEAAPSTLDPPASIGTATPAGPDIDEKSAARPERDWAALGERVRAQVLANGWWRDPELELAELARRVGTNTNYLSRALNEGLGMRFSEFINRLRVEAAQPLLREGGEVLAVAFAVGFQSKASFNRAFKAYTGTTPSEWRSRAPRQAG